MPTQLLDGMAKLAGGWPERVLVMQRNWIGKSQGARVQFAVADTQIAAPGSFHHARRYDLWSVGRSAFRGPSQCAEMLAGVPGGTAMEQQLKAMQQRSMKAADIATAEKEGFFTGRFAANPFSGERVPIWVANFVLAEYGTGAVMAVPAHDQRDFEFAEKYQAAGKIVIQPLQARRCAPIA